MHQRILFLFMLGVALEVAHSQDPCLEENHIPMDALDGRRHIDYSAQQGEAYLCDEQRVTGEWQRIQEMPITGQSYALSETCIAMYKCGTQYPIWLSGSHPADDTIVTRTACISFSSDPSADDTQCCEHTLNVNIKRCASGGSHFFVYQFVQPQCPAAYCAMEQELLYGETLPTEPSSTNNERSSTPQVPTIPNNGDDEVANEDSDEDDDRDGTEHEDQDGESEEGEQNGDHDPVVRECEECDECHTVLFYIVISLLCGTLLASVLVNIYMCMTKDRNQGVYEDGRSGPFHNIDGLGSGNNRSASKDGNYYQGSKTGSDHGYDYITKSPVETTNTYSEYSVKGDHSNYDYPADSKPSSMYDDLPDPS